MIIERAKSFCEECIKQIPILENEKFGNLLLSSIKLSILNSQNVGYDIALKINDSKKFTRIVNEREILFVYSTPMIFGDDYRNHQIECFLETKPLIDEFLNQRENQFNFLRLSDFNAYLNTTKTKNDIERYLKSKNYSDFNFNEWIQYFINLFSFFYSQYKIEAEISNKNELFFFKESKDDVLLGFTLNLKELKSEIRKGFLCLNRPKLVLLHKNKGGLSIEKLGEFVHPYFSLFVQLQSFQCLLAQDDLTDIVYTKYNRLTFNTLSNGLIEIAGNEKFAEECKKMAFFQIGLESKFNLQYISFLEKIYCK